MTADTSSRALENTLQKERRIFKKQLKRLIDCFFNKVFDMTSQGSHRRSRALFLLFIVLGFLLSLLAHPLEEWGRELGYLFQYAFNAEYRQVVPEAPLAFMEFVRGVVFDPQLLRYLPVVLFPFIIALQAAATYLADVFELGKVEIARDFILQVAVGGIHKKIRIGGGEVSAKNRESPIYLIGGPGKVVVELDTVAVFEKPDGQPHIIGPTTEGAQVLEGFERFRQAIDLRNQYADPLEVKSRSLDGIPVSATDVRMVFSIWRENQGATAKSPHPFSEKAVRALVYNQPSKVILDGPHPSEPPVSWTGTVQGLIHSKLGEFMSKHRLAEYLASIGSPEIQEARQRENDILQVGKKIIAKGDSLAPRDVPPPPDFHSRQIVSSLFNQFASDFTQKASQRGVELHWIGVGTWKTPSEIVPEKHLEAWHLSRENVSRGSEAAMQAVRQETRIQQTLRSIQKVPLGRYQQSQGEKHQHRLRDLLIAYREQLIEAIEILEKSQRKPPGSIYQAIEYIERSLGFKHWVGFSGRSSTPGTTKSSYKSGSSAAKRERTLGAPSILPEPPEPEREALFQDLLQKTGQDPENIELLIELERKQDPHADPMELLQRVAERLLKD